MSDYNGFPSSKYSQKLLHLCSTQNIEVPSLKLPFAKSFPSSLYTKLLSPDVIHEWDFLVKHTDQI